MNLVNYLVASSSPLPPVKGIMYDYILAQNDLFVRAKREGLTVIAPLQKKLAVAGLVPLEPLFQLHYPLIPTSVVETMLKLSYAAIPNEMLFQLYWDKSWHLYIPQQQGTPKTVRRLSSHPQTLIEVHSHPTFPACFSATDNAEEGNFRIYGVIGNLHQCPQIRVRVGIYHSCFWEIPATWVFELPSRVSS